MKSPSKKSQNLIRVVMGTLVSRGVTAVGSFVLSLQLAHQLTLEEFGRFSFCLTLLVALTMIARYGCDLSLLKYAGAAWHNHDLGRFANVCRFSLRVTSRLSLLLTAAGGLVLGLTYSLGWDTAVTMLVMILGLLPMTMIYVISSCFKSSHRSQVGALFEIGSISMLCGAVSALLGWGGVPLTAESTSAIFVLLSTLVAGVGYTCVSRLWLADNNDVLDVHFDRTEFLNTSRDFTLIANAQVLGNWGGLLLLGLFRDEAEVGVYAAVLRIALIPSLLVNIVVSICSPRLSGLHESGDVEGFRRLVKASATGIFLVNFPILFLTAVLSQPLMALFGAKFTPHSNLLALVAIGLAAQTATALASSILSMDGRHVIVRRVTLVSSIGATLLSAQLIYWLGATGAAIGFALYSTLHPLIMATIVKRELGFWPLPGNLAAIARRRLSSGTGLSTVAAEHRS